MLTYWQEDRNWGDILPPYLVRRIGGAEPIRARRQAGGKLLSVGSVLHHMKTDDVVWGSGFINSVPRKIPERLTVRAVRGPLTRQLFLDRGRSVPDTYGDPAILIPHLIQCARRSRFALGVIPHYAEYAATPPWETRSDEVTRIDILGGLFEVIGQVCDCAAILSSSLHGLVLAESYGIPAVWVKFTKSKVLGGSFKFWDYYAATSRFPYPVDFSGEPPRLLDLAGVVSSWGCAPPGQANYELAESLLRCCPFNSQYTSLDELPVERIDRAS